MPEDNSLKDTLENFLTVAEVHLPIKLCSPMIRDVIPLPELLDGAVPLASAMSNIHSTDSPSSRTTC